MAVLKRFSYDNIVEHNPTAPDPVDYDGGGDGGGTETVIFDQNADPITANRTHQEVLDLLNSGVPVIACVSGSVLGTGYKHFMMLHASGTHIYGAYVSFDPSNNGMYGESFEWDDEIMSATFDYTMTPAT